MVLGGARLLGGLAQQREELYARPERWRDRCATPPSSLPATPSRSGSSITGYLATWPALSAAERAAAPVCAEGFQDRDTLDQLLPGWAAVAGNRAELEAVLPAEPSPTTLLQQAAASQRTGPASAPRASAGCRSPSPRCGSTSRRRSVG